MKVRFLRRNNVILDVRTEEERTTIHKSKDAEGKETELKSVEPTEPPRACDSINKAKKLSVQLQKSHGAGCLRVDKEAMRQHRPTPVKYRKRPQAATRAH